MYLAYKRTGSSVDALDSPGRNRVDAYKAPIMLRTPCRAACNNVTTNVRFCVFILVSEATIMSAYVNVVVIDP